jgi:branched-chain amino acid transport system permease protein
MLASAIISGIGLGSMYGLIALGFHITYVVSSTVNFAQGSAMMLGAVLGYTFGIRLGWPMPLAVLVALSVCALFGLVVERILVRPFVSRGSNAWLMATVAAGIVLDNAVLFTFGKEPRGFPSALADQTIKIFGTGVYPLQLVIPLVGIGAALIMHLTLRHTRRGKTLLAVVQTPDASRLMGINVHRTVAVGTLFGIKAFAVAILGGMSSAWGVVIAGLAYGLIEALVTSFLGSVYTQIVVFSVVILALTLMPNGLFGRAAINKV